MNTVTAETARIALLIKIKDTDEEVGIKFARPEQLDYELFQISLHKSWYIAATWLADQYGQRV